ncbi:hypothetical protein SCHPADRAFT_995033 [Schizopora paradoxa]|uniref:Uncharacterized protein n=1 Tax=Schizopora paradoxa TaxID=27342 RepID=A0A0H2SHQ8_9AGAM|nr:hypothetical protein SCHPADRAFT_995033 [Schizopora paradoxa]
MTDALNSDSKTKDSGRGENGSLNFESQHLPVVGVNFLQASNERCGCESLPPETLVQIFELVAESSWRDGVERRPSTADTNTALSTPSGALSARRRDDAKPKRRLELSEIAELLEGKKKRDARFPYAFFCVCKQWLEIASRTAALWSYISITERSTFENVFIRIAHSRSHPLSIHYSRAAMLEIFKKDDTNTKLLGLLISQAKRWLRFILSAGDPLIISNFTPIISLLSNQMDRLIEFRLQKEPDSSQEGYISFKPPVFRSPMQSLRKLSLSQKHYSIPLILESNPLSIQEMFPSLMELEIAFMDGELLEDRIRSLAGLPLLRALKIIDFHHKGAGEDLIENFPRVALTSLEELTVQEFDGSAAELFLDLVSMPNLRSLSLIETGLLKSFVDTAPENLQLSNIQNLSLEGARFDEGGQRSHQQLETELLSAMPGITSIHLNHESRDFAQALIQTLEEPKDLEDSQPSSNPLLPNLSKMSLLGFDDDVIEDILKARQAIGVPLDALEVIKSPIFSGEKSCTELSSDCESEDSEEPETPQVEEQIERPRWWKFLSKSLHKLKLMI